ncbi:Carbohydrate sulfotransferase 15, partial [Bulinus truncatus]
KTPRFLTNYKNPCWYERKASPENDRTLRCLPYFHVIGVDKCGTTDFWNRLTKHPEIVSPNAVLDKETHWWSWRRFGFDIWVNDQKIKHFERYLQYFDRPSKVIEKNTHPNDSRFHHLITGEGSPTIFWDFTGWDKIPQNYNKTPETALTTPDCIKHLTPRAKFIAIFRNPTTRLYSDYIFLDYFRPYHNISAEIFHQDVLRSIEMFQECLIQHTELFCLYSKQIHMNIPVRLFVGMYDVFLATWLKVFPKDQILVFRNEDYSSNIRVYLQKTFDFLGLTPLQDSDLDRLESLPRMYETKKAKDLAPMLSTTKDILDRFYAKYNQQLARRLQDSRFLWLN